MAFAVYSPGADGAMIDASRFVRSIALSTQGRNRLAAITVREATIAYVNGLPFAGYIRHSAIYSYVVVCKRI